MKSKLVNKLQMRINKSHLHFVPQVDEIVLRMGVWEWGIRLRVWGFWGMGYGVWKYGSIGIAIELLWKTLADVTRTDTDRCCHHGNLKRYSCMPLIRLLHYILYIFSLAPKRAQDSGICSSCHTHRRRQRLLD